MREDINVDEVTQEVISDGVFPREFVQFRPVTSASSLDFTGELRYFLELCMDYYVTGLTLVYVTSY